MRKSLLAAAAVMTAAMAAVPASAVPVVLSGNYIRVGISDAGTFGSNGNADPAFVHDPSGTGTFNPNFDYVAPGIPHDGFSLVSGQFSFRGNDNASVGSSAFATTSGPALLTGGAARGYANAASWSGANAFASITNSYFFNPNDERVLVSTVIFALTDLTSLAFARSVDPDSDSRSFGTASSNNQRGNSLFGADDFIGSAGSVSGRTLALVNVDAKGKAHTTQINNDCCSNINPNSVLAHTGGDLGLSSVGDHGLNLAYNVGALSKGSSIELLYAYAVGDRIDVVGAPPPVVTPVSAVPEPATWAFMIAGIGMTGGGLRRRRGGTLALRTA